MFIAQILFLIYKFESISPRLSTSRAGYHINSRRIKREKNVGRENDVIGPPIGELNPFVSCRD